MVLQIFKVLFLKCFLVPPDSGARIVSAAEGFDAESNTFGVVLFFLQAEGQTTRTEVGVDGVVGAVGDYVDEIGIACAAND